VAIDTPEYAAKFGAIDTNALPDGGPFSAQLMRMTAKNANRLIRKGQLLCSLAWPLKTNNTTTDSNIASTFQGIATPVWSRIHPPIFCPKKPGLTKATVKLVAHVQDGALQFQFTTRATGTHGIQHARVADANVMELSGGSGLQLFTLTDLPLDPGDSEVIEIWSRTGSGAALMDTATYGTPNVGTHGTGGVTINRDGIVATSAAWTLTAPNMSTTDHMIYLYDGGGGFAGAPRRVTQVVSATELRFAPLGAWFTRMIRDTSGTFEIRTHGSNFAFSVASIAIAADARDT